MPSNPIFRFLNGMHRGLIAVSAGQAGWNVGGMTVLEVTTTGRNSGRDRTVFLTSPIQDGDSMLVVASRGGDDRHPDEPADRHDGQHVSEGLRQRRGGVPDAICQDREGELRDHKKRCNEIKQITSRLHKKRMNKKELYDSINLSQY